MKQSVVFLVGELFAKRKKLYKIQRARPRTRTPHEHFVKTQKNCGVMQAETGREKARDVDNYNGWIGTNGQIV